MNRQTGRTSSRLHKEVCTLKTDRCELQMKRTDGVHPLVVAQVGQDASTSLRSLHTQVLHPQEELDSVVPPENSELFGPRQGGRGWAATHLSMMSPVCTNTSTSPDHAPVESTTPAISRTFCAFPKSP